MSKEKLAPGCDWRARAVCFSRKQDPLTPRAIEGTIDSNCSINNIKSAAQKNFADLVSTDPKKFGQKCTIGALFGKHPTDRAYKWFPTKEQKKRRDPEPSPITDNEIRNTLSEVQRLRKTAAKRSGKKK